jgi:magnesium chelatase family protein
VAPQALAQAPDGEPTSQIAERVARARDCALARQGCANAELTGAMVDAHCALDAAGLRFLQAAATRLGWSARSYHRVLRTSRTVADLAGRPSIETSHLAEAIQYRRLLTAAT